jgi:DNA-binding transcriptional regulator YiaG
VTFTHGSEAVSLDQPGSFTLLGTTATPTRRGAGPLLIGALLVLPLAPTTSSAMANGIINVRSVGDGTTSGGYQLETATDLSATALAVRRVRARTGLTWEELAKVLGVSRRAVHAWAAGGRLTHHHALRLRRVAEVLEAHDAGAPELTRAAVHAPTSAGTSLFQQLVRTTRPAARPAMTPADRLAASEPALVAQARVIERQDIE